MSRKIFLPTEAQSPAHICKWRINHWLTTTYSVFLTSEDSSCNLLIQFKRECWIPSPAKRESVLQLSCAKRWNEEISEVQNGKVQKGLQSQQRRSRCCNPHNPQWLLFSTGVGSPLLLHLQLTRVSIQNVLKVSIIQWPKFEWVWVCSFSASNRFFIHGLAG